MKQFWGTRAHYCAPALLSCQQQAPGQLCPVQHHPTQHHSAQHPHPWHLLSNCDLPEDLTRGQPHKKQRLPAMSNCTEISSVLQDRVMLFQLIVYIPVLVLGLLLNTIAFWVFCCKLKRWTETRVYMINLMFADCSLLFTLPFLIYFTKNKYPIDKLCFAIEVIHFTNSPMSIFIIMLIAIDRYIAIKFPLKARTLRSPLKSACICGFLWIMQIGYSYLSMVSKKKNEHFCFQKHSTEPAYLISISICFWYFIPLLIIIFCSVQVIRCLRKKMASSHRETKLIQKAIHVISVNLCVFILCFSPIYIASLLRLAAELAGACHLLSKFRVSIQILSCLANSNCCLDAFCYYFAAKESQEFPSLLPTCISLRSKMNQSQESQQPTDQVTP
ncbi:G-protein coupled receptor 35-like isoform X1 [Centrocercus urophasianus]|uniref:G-protein coupled receptor 35-like isoform X1 n=2 Tax=Centrocercus urophasianus TaxID=9002 RepID=UPI001C650DB1|nr:G-protein coupled receptor 35-like isoform X1 [Centrocercus urophasianus]